MPRAQVGDIELEYEVTGSGDPLLMIMGLGAQLTAWPDGLRSELAARGFQVIVFDNRDVGLSTKLDDGEPYTLWDMADDASGLLDHLGIDAAHVVGASMGGMIAQCFAIRHTARVRTLTSIMSTTGDPSVGAPTPEAMERLLLPPKEGRDGQIDQAVETTRVIWGDAEVFPFDESAIRERAEATYDRCFHPMGRLRHLQAIQATGDRTAELRDLRIPTLVVHGDADPLVTHSGGVATANAIPGAELLTIAGMGHSLPEPTWPELAAAIAKLTSRA